MSPVIDGSVIEEREPLPPGMYDARFAEFSLEDGDKAQYYKMVYECQSEDGDENVAGRKLFTNKSLSPQALWSFKQACIAMGADPDTFKGQFDTEAVLEPLVGAEVRLKVSQRKYEDRITNNIDRILAPGFGV
jgi:hypothetical protein